MRGAQERGQAPLFRFACPLCGTPLEQLEATELCCPSDRARYPLVHGIWRLLPAERKAYYEQFMQEYAHVRESEERGADDAAYYRALPFEDLTGRFTQDWMIRATSFRTLLTKLVVPLEQACDRPLAVLDVGAGNGWLSYRLARRGNTVAAIDLQTSKLDGLGAYIYYDVAFTPLQGDFDRLPFLAEQIDLVVFNGSLHYSTEYIRTLREALRVLRPGGVVAIMDSPIYHDATSGEQMVRERERQFEARYGFPSNAIPSENFLTYRRLKELAERLGVEWEFYRPWYGWRWALRPWRARLRGHREPAQFLVIATRRVGSG
ncbi:MAG: methyltransferase domain-containing protein [Chloroflexota bacterium]|nr:methyltransferase domain-containing protein [Chloroflexota bacterium]